MRIADLHFKGLYNKLGRVPASPTNKDVARRKIALAEGLVDAYDGDLADRNRRPDALTLFDEESHDLVQVKTQKDGSRHYHFEHNNLEQGLFTGRRSVLRERIEVSPKGQVLVRVDRGSSVLGGYLTGPLFEERLPNFGPGQEFFFSDSSLGP